MGYWRHWTHSDQWQADSVLIYLQIRHRGWGIDLGSIYILDGQEGIDALDPTGEAHGLMGKLSRTFHQGYNSTEREKINKLVSHLSEGGVAVADALKKKTLRDALIELYRAHNGEEITYAATLYIEDFKAQSSNSSEEITNV